MSNGVNCLKFHILFYQTRILEKQPKMEELALIMVRYLYDQIHSFVHKIFSKIIANFADL